ncbi:MAG: hypothetical protein PHD43_08225 [Methylococcales bacterium]|nr:hypothetical protein [Methylococcales bacterium]
MTATAEHLSKTAADTLCKKSQQMKHIEERFLENCRPYVHDKPVTSLSIAVALGRQDAGRDKVAGFMTGKLMRPQRPQSVPCRQARAPSQNAHTPKRGAQLVDLGPKHLPRLVLGPDDAYGQTVTSGRTRSASLASNRVPPITAERPRPMPGGKTSCL